MSFKDSSYNDYELASPKNKIKPPFFNSAVKWVLGKNILVHEVQNKKPYTNDYINKSKSIHWDFFHYEVYIADEANSFKKICTLPRDESVLIFSQFLADQL